MPHVDAAMSSSASSAPRPAAGRRREAASAAGDADQQQHERQHARQHLDLAAQRVVLVVEDRRFGAVAPERLQRVPMLLAELEDGVGGEQRDEAAAPAWMPARNSRPSDCSADGARIIASTVAADGQLVSSAAMSRRWSSGRCAAPALGCRRGRIVRRGRHRPPRRRARTRRRWRCRARRGCDSSTRAAPRRGPGRRAIGRSRRPSG